MMPHSKPKALRATVESAAATAWESDDDLPAVYVVGVRAYYRDSMGGPGNQRSIYDDALFIVAPDIFAAFNGNTDPSAYRKGIATLCLGVHWYKPGNHGISRPGGGYPAFRPATPNEELPVQRDGVKVPWPGVAINIHRGGANSTSSEGCQTIPPGQWDDFHRMLTAALKKAGQKKFPYILVEGPLV